MKIVLESLSKVMAECLNHPDDVYIYFNGGYIVHSSDCEYLTMQYNGDRIRIGFEPRKMSGKEVASRFNEQVCKWQMS